ncbi:hypothetical protein SAMN02745163_02974 [Clostridium cavendishii DSM 21758]|uniref:Uncharacterized protein n=1 Tax=Clostridium cavendishii DSM 21758 TaxID=1121302 RepID=A0A1M6NPS7_9CLOT|nr:hypothetical protein [Clostridium cavendishii]SHJ97741.1 hypothetical protein SAMN02745163_02974 [Clostridium cavendishii DSM 21758]
MDNMDVPVCGKLARLELLKKDFVEQIENCISSEEVNLTVGWYLKYGLAIGIPKECLIESIHDNSDLYKTAKLLTDMDILQGRTPPLFREGDIVEVIVNVKNTTYHKGVIFKTTYHFVENEWMYYIIENNKKISKRYFKNDLALINKANFTNY